jgi:hypothetical protein
MKAAPSIRMEGPKLVAWQPKLVSPEEAVDAAQGRASQLACACSPTYSPRADFVPSRAAASRPEAIRRLKDLLDRARNQTMADLPPAHNRPNSACCKTDVFRASGPARHTQDKMRGAIV